MSEASEGSCRSPPHSSSRGVVKKRWNSGSLDFCVKQRNSMSGVGVKKGGPSKMAEEICRPHETWKLVDRGLMRSARSSMSSISQRKTSSSTYCEASENPSGKKQPVRISSGCAAG